MSKSHCCLPDVVYFSRHSAEQLTLEDKLALLVLLACLVSLVVLPTHCFLALSAVDVAYDVAAGGHVALVRLRLGDVDNDVEKVRFAVLTPEVLSVSARAAQAAQAVP
jgi:hypothetical protein